MRRVRWHPRMLPWGATLLLVALALERGVAAFPFVQGLMQRPPAGAYRALGPFGEWLVPNLLLLAGAIALWSLAFTWGATRGSPRRAAAWLWAGCLVWLVGAVLPLTFAARRFAQALSPDPGQSTRSLVNQRLELLELARPSLERAAVWGGIALIFAAGLLFVGLARPGRESEARGRKPKGWVHGWGGTWAVVIVLGLVSWGGSRMDAVLAAELAAPFEPGWYYSATPQPLSALEGAGPDKLVDAPQVIASGGGVRIDGLPASGSEFSAVLRNKRELWRQLNPGRNFPGWLSWMLEPSFDPRRFAEHLRRAVRSGYPQEQLLLQSRIVRQGPLLKTLLGVRNSALSFYATEAAWQCPPNAAVSFLEPRPLPLPAFAQRLEELRSGGPRRCSVLPRWPESSGLQQEAAQALDGAVEAYRLTVDGHRYQVLLAPRVDGFYSTPVGERPRVEGDAPAREDPTEAARAALPSYAAPPAPPRGTEGLRVDVRSLVEEGHADADFSELDARLHREGRRVVFLMNGGMYHPDRLPVGLLLHRGQEWGKLSRKRGRGNFFLMPNGIFGSYAGVYSVKSTEEWAATSATILGNHPDYVYDATAARTHGVDASSAALFERPAEDATQSGPLLLDHGTLHPALEPNSTSRHVRNGVGLGADGNSLFVISLEPVSLYEFARLFQRLGCPSALYLDGNVSALYAPGLGRRDRGSGLGPVIAATVPAR